MRAWLAVLLFIPLFGLSQDSTRIIIQSGIDAMLAGNNEKSLEYLVKAKARAIEEEDKENLYLAYNNIGANYYTLLDYGEALSNYLEAYRIAVEYLTPAQEMTVLNNIAILYSKEENYEKAEEYFVKAYDIAVESNMTKNIGIYAINLGHVMNETDQYEKAGAYIDQAIAIFEDDPRMLLEAQLIKAQNLSSMGKDDQALELALKNKKQFIGPEFQDHRVANNLIISTIYYNKKNWPQAINYATEELDNDLNAENKIDIYEQLSKIYIEQNEPFKALAVKDSLIVAHDELATVKNGRLYESEKVKFEIANYQRELEYQQEKIEAQKKQFLILLIGSVLLLSLLAWALQISYEKAKQKKILHQKSEELMRLELESEKTKKELLERQLKEKEAIALLRQEKLKNDIESKNRKLSAKALYLSNRNSLIETVITDLEKMYRVRRDPELKSHIDELKTLLRADSEWESFIKHFEEVNQSFINNLKTQHSELNNNDIRFLSYTYMNLSTKEISNIFNITPEACRKRKERVSKKMGLEHSSELYDHLYQLN